jgi:hypothetical protein
MIDVVRDVAFAEESGTRVAAEADLHVEELDRAPFLVSMRGGVDGCHAPDAEERVEPPFAAQHLADARFGPESDRVLGIDHRCMTQGTAACSSATIA